MMLDNVHTTSKPIHMKLAERMERIGMEGAFAVNMRARALEAVRVALEIPADERRARMGRMRLAVREHNIYRWAGLLLSELQRIPEANAGAQSNVLSSREGER